MKTFTAVILLASIGSIMGIRCYVCTYGAAGLATNTDACLDPFSADGSHDPISSDANGTSINEHLLDIDCGSVLPSYDVCAKTIGTVNGVFTVARSCFAGAVCPDEGGCVSGNGATVCCCGTDGCNGAGSVAVNIASIVALFFSTVMFTL